MVRCTQNVTSRVGMSFLGVRGEKEVEEVRAAVVKRTVVAVRKVERGIKGRSHTDSVAKMRGGR